MSSGRFGVSIVLLALGVCSACGSAAPAVRNESGGPRPAATGDSMASSSASASGDLNAAHGAPACDVTPVHFAFDSSELDGAAREQAAQNARCIVARGARGVRVVGLTDPRGTEEYNLALGERRARSVTQYMASMGVDASSVQTHSMGEEMASGADESSWARDRRADVELH